MIRDAATLRAVAHPARMRILEQLVMQGPMTATACSALTGLSPSACSYHLRLLGRAGLVQEAPAAADHRQRPWGATFQSLAMQSSDPARGGPEFDSAALEVVRELLAISQRRTMEYLDHEAQETPEWQGSAGFDQNLLDLTAAETKALREEIEKLVDPYSVASRKPGPISPSRLDSRLVHFEFRLIPLRGDDQ